MIDDLPKHQFQSNQQVLQELLAIGLPLRFAPFQQPLIPDGSSLMIGGFGPPGMPQNLIGALLRRGAKDLTVIVNRLDSSWAKAD